MQAKIEADKRMQSSSDERKRYAKDLEIREKLFKESFLKVFKKQSEQQLNELDQLIRDVKKKERQESEIQQINTT